MKFVYLAAYKVRGLVHETTSPDIVLFDGAEPMIKVVVTNNLSKHWRILDRGNALAIMLFNGMIGDPIADDFRVNLETQIDAIQKSRTESLGDASVLVVELRGPLQTQPRDPICKIDDYVLYFDAFDKKELTASLQPQVSAALLAMRTGANSEYRFESVVSGSYALADDGQIVHSLSFEESHPEVFVSKPLTDEQIKQVKQDADLIRKSKSLERVVRLHSLNLATDRFRAFISAWSALEILVAKIFPTYQTKLTDELAAINGTPGLRSYIDRISSIMKDKHNIADKFAVISIYLDIEQNYDEVECFRRLKKTRDLLSHGEDVLESSLPTEKIQQLFEKYLRNHLRNDA